MSKTQNQPNSQLPENVKQVVAKMKAVYEEAKAKLDELEKEQDALIQEFTEKFEQEQFDKVRQNLKKTT